MPEALFPPAATAPRSHPPAEASKRPAIKFPAIKSPALAVAVIWIDWYAYHRARFAGLAAHPELRGRVVGIELVGGVGVHAGLRFREPLPPDWPVETLFPDENWDRAGQARVARRLWARLDALDPAVVLVPGYYTLPGLAAAAWARARGRTAVLMTESGRGDHRRGAWKEWAKAALLRGLFPWAVAGGAPHVRYLRELGFVPERIRGFYDVVDNSEIAARVEEARRRGRVSHGLPREYFLYVGRLAPEKNVTGLLRSYLTYRDEGGTWPLVLAGDGPERAALERQACASTYSADIVFAGHQSSSALPAYYAFAGCFVLPSTREPWGLVVNEAMAAALPVLVSTRCGCAEDLLAHGENGWIFDPARSGDLTAKLHLVEQLTPEARARMGARSRERIEPYSPENWGREIAAVVRACRSSA